MKAIKILISDSHITAINLAFEHFLITNSAEDILLFYRNMPSVVLGKHQNPWLEADILRCKANYISIHRRISGGGTVYHDLNNLNFCFIRNKIADFVDFKEHIVPISEALMALGIENRITQRNDIFIGEKKISGNAEHVNSSKKRILHHGTLLYDTDLSILNGSIKPPILPNIFTHAVNSNRSPVVNIKAIQDLGSMEVFINQLIDQLTILINIEKIAHINPEDNPTVTNLSSTIYDTNEWNFGHTPQFKYTPIQGLNITVRKGKIISIDDQNEILQNQNDFIELPISHSLLTENNYHLTLADEQIYTKILLP